ncbi:uncharacterized protein CANTADRAFT_4420 [Suhomyces tanzawaensis NRRL Y-17324]|uniref:Mitochondrial 15S rRNA processing factor CCM1 n=1 Tax=Suhomyces tanzawaensis NRRL Y-17324 TaxID=984487 RepID=A0A1E4SSD6_9ASCO|nr:uncharacterized protein CANTADRAFT_4420 [Suhomyces tanzawaensis NRRL Y-17324]ODV82426.1 hypothetical protein CANTADRAFT_4420 [Suhomyces tanzawaensis NRRL Y-17324]
MSVRCLRSYSTSNIKSKLDHYIETGQISKYAPRQLERKFQKGPLKSEAYSPQKALLILKAKYDSSLFQDANGQGIRLSSLAAKDLGVSSPKSLQIYKNLHHIKSATRKSIDKRLLLALMGTNEAQLKDPYLVTADVLKLLERDGETTRALGLIRLARAGSSVLGIVGMNAILQWLLEKRDHKQAIKCLNDRKKWGIPLNSHTYVILFDGLSTSHEWGKAQDETCQFALELFEKYRVESIDGDPKKLGKCGIEHFNALLSFLVKNFTNEQELAWAVFDTLKGKKTDDAKKIPTLVPNSQTFTIFLNGLKKYSEAQATTIKANKKLTNKAKSAQLIKNHQTLVETANLILDKVIKASTPPIPPTKEQAQEDPEVLVTYRAQMNRILMTIDPAFVSVFVSCYINGFSGSGVDIDGGSHYKYVQQGLEYLKAWCPEIDQMFQFVNEQARADNIISPGKSVKYITDTRLKNSQDDKEDLTPTLPQLDPSKINPMVVFPPSPFSKNKTRAIFSDKKKPLVDFTRLTYDEVQMILADKNFKDSRGKYGKKMPANIQLTQTTKKQGINKFLLMNVFDGLVRLGRHQEFILSMWYALDRWGGLDLQKEFDYFKCEKFLTSERYPKFYVDKKEVGTQVDTKKLTEKQKSTDDSIVDLLLVENLIYKLNEQFKQKGLSANNTIVEVFSALVNKDINLAYKLVPRFKTVDVIFSSLMTDIHYFNDYTFNQEQLNKSKESKEPKELKVKNTKEDKYHRYISKDQLSHFLPSLAHFMDSLLVFESQKSSQDKYLLPNMYLESLNRILDRLYSAAWINVNAEDSIMFHKYIIRSGIMLFKPREFVDPREKLEYASIIKSLRAYHQWFKENKNLSKQDVRMGNSIKALFQLRKTDTDSEDKLKSILKSIYRHSEQ